MDLRVLALKSCVGAATYLCMAYKGFFKPRNHSKYIGDPTKIMYRSMWERKFMKFCDENTNVIRWASEEVVIPYVSPVDKKPHRYFVDFLVEIKTPEGIKTWLVEIKPLKQCKQPEKKSRVTRTYISEVKTWLVNSAKWEAAKRVSQAKGWEFKILTEQDLFKKP
jgi:hypothetical protein